MTRGEPPVTVSFNGSNSYAYNDTITSYSWNFGDGSSSNSASVSHLFAARGIYVVTLTITTAGGHSGETQFVIIAGTCINGDAIDYQGGTITQDTTLPNLHIPYIVRNTISISNGVTFTIDPGVQLLFYDNTGISSSGILSRLVANGTAQDPIKFNGINQPRTNWGGISCRADALSYCQVSYGPVSIGPAPILRTPR